MKLETVIKSLKELKEDYIECNRDYYIALDIAIELLENGNDKYDLYDIIKTEKEIRDEIESAIRTIKNHQKAYKDGEIPKESLDYSINDNQSTISVLLWVLGENDRYD